jgi:hypothetical protein
MVTEDVEIDGHKISTFGDLAKWYRTVNADGVVAGVSETPTETVPAKPRVMPARDAAIICHRPPFGITKMPKMVPRPPKQIAPPATIKAAVSAVKRRNPVQTAGFVRAI